MQSLSWSTEKRKIKDLIPSEKNPRKISAKGKIRLESKIQRLGLFEIPSIDHSGQLLNYNQRLKILLALDRGEEEIDVRVPSRPLTVEERGEILLSSNIHEGEWEAELLEAYRDLDLSEIGIDDELLKEMEAMQNEEEATATDEPAYPIVPKFSEKYDAFVIVSANEIDTTFLEEILNLDTRKCYKSSNVGQTHVIKAEDFIKSWKSRS